MDDQSNPHTGAFEAPIALRLSKRERAIVELLSSGLRVGEIAMHLGLSVKTISTYRTRAMLKLRIKTTAQLMQFWREQHPEKLEPTEAVAPSALFASSTLESPIQPGVPAPPKFWELNSA